MLPDGSWGNIRYNSTDRVEWPVTAPRIIHFGFFWLARDYWWGAPTPVRRGVGSTTISALSIR